MAIIRRFIHTSTNSLGEPMQECVIEIDAEIVGTIETTTGNRFHVNTKGLVPAIDDISGSSFHDVWAKIVERVRAGGVCYTKFIASAEPGDG